MFNKTTSYTFSKYGEIVNEISRRQFLKFQKQTIKLKNKSISNFTVCNDDVYVKVLSGIVMIVATNDEQQEQVDKFVIHRFIKIKKGVMFNFISITESAKIEMTHSFKIKRWNVDFITPVPYQHERIIPAINIHEIYAYFYQVRNAGYSYPDEYHSYWELTFIDNGSLYTTIDGEDYHLNNFDIILYAPNQVHNQSTNKDSTCSYLTILFDMNIQDPSLIANRVFKSNREIHNAFNNFKKVSSNEYLYDNDLMICYLKEVIIRLLQYDFQPQLASSSPTQQRFENDLLNDIIIYINENIYSNITVEDICVKFSISRSSLQNLFKNSLNTAPKQYINELKLSKAKLLIKESSHTISEISEILGYTSIHYFSRKFKQHFGITPTDYAKTIYN